MSVALSAAALISAALTIRSQLTHRTYSVYIYKPLTTSLIVVLALARALPGTTTYEALVLAGLVFSLAGDLFLMLPNDRFTLGLVAFLMAQVCYTIGFSADARQSALVWHYIPFILYALALYRHLRRGAGKHHVPVLVYALTIVTMAWLAMERWLALGDTPALMAAAGALCFVASDTALAINRFRRPFRLSPLIVLGTYYTAQILIALSIQP